MFYSHEVLTSRKYGVATIWLVATLGSKSGLKKVSRRAILDVDVPKACESILEPSAPMALRLQSNLLYGVARVYSQQCGYVLTDAEHARNSLRALVSVVRAAGLEAEGANKGKQDHLVLRDDPSFLLDLDLVPADLSNLELLNEMDQREEEDTQMLSSTRDSTQLAQSSQRSFGGLMIPGSASSMTPAGGGDLFGIGRDSSTFGRGQQPVRLLDDEDLELDLGFDDQIEEHHRSVGHGSGAHGGCGRFSVPPLASIEDAGPMDDVGFLPDANDGVPTLPGHGADPTHHPTSDIDMQDDETSTETAQVAIRRKRRPKVKYVPLDGTTELRNHDLNQWNKDYLLNMQNAARHKDLLRISAIAKTNAEEWVLGSVLGMGRRDPLDMFSGARIIEAFTGINLLKRSLDEDDTSTERRVRPRSAALPNEIVRGMDLDDQINTFLDDEDTIEQGRDAPTPLEDRRLSSLLPWNAAASAGSRARSTSGPPGGGGSVFSRRGSRLISASPLHRQSGFLSQVPDQHNDGGLEDHSAFQLPMPDTLLTSASGNDYSPGGLGGGGDYELFGPAAQVDTQTAGNSQWQRAALIGESANFLAFVRAAIEGAEAQIEAEAQGAEATADTSAARNPASEGKSVTFETLLPPAENSAIVAAQALLHVLSLGTRNFLRVRQEEAFGSLSMSLI